MSRQLAVFGHEVQGKLMIMRVFMHGLTGVILKQILGGIRSCQELDPGWTQVSEYL